MTTRDRGIFIAFALIIFVLPFLIKGSYLFHTFVFVGINTILAVSLNLLLGYAGQISLGHGAFFGLGAYLSAILTTKYGVNPWLAMAGVAIVVALLAAIVGFPILRLQGHYLAMATLGLGIIMYILFNETVEWTGGPSGFPGIPSLKLGTIVFDSDRNCYYLVWICALLAILFSLQLVHSRIGRALRALSDSEVAARMMGIDAWILKVQVFAVSAFLASLAGSLYAHILTFIAPATFGFNFSLELLTMVVVGGLGSIYGSFIGATVITLLPELLRVFQDFDVVIYGLLLIVMIDFHARGYRRG